MHASYDSASAPRRPAARTPPPRVYTCWPAGWPLCHVSQTTSALQSGFDYSLGNINCAQFAIGSATASSSSSAGANVNMCVHRRDAAVTPCARLTRFSAPALAACYLHNNAARCFASLMQKWAGCVMLSELVIQAALVATFAQVRLCCARSPKPTGLRRCE
ncbi:hypothetical protein EON66_01785 [archaeon]|nr:MAG: hypothetical protein EON66_01785 [archaeon]